MSYPTWSDLNSPSIVPPPGAGKSSGGGSVAVMVSAVQDFRFIAANFGKWDQSPFLNSSMMTQTSGDMAVAGPYIGAPYGVMLQEFLIGRGARHILVIGWCGALTDTLSPGDFIIPSLAFCDEGTSRHYMEFKEGEWPSARPDEDLSRRLSSALESRGQTVHTVPIWTTDAIYRETREKVDGFTEKGAWAVEMECSALFAAGRYRKVGVTALLVVSDSLARDAWEPGFTKKQFKANRRIACHTVMDLARTLTS